MKHLVELQGGRITVASDPHGHGAIFTMVLPVPAVHDAAAASGERRTPDPFDVRLPGRSVPVVDDDAATRELLCALFDQAEATVTATDSAAAAFAAVQARPPEVIIADIGLPVEDGCSLMRRIRALPPPASTSSSASPPCRRTSSSRLTICSSIRRPAFARAGELKRGPRADRLMMAHSHE